MAKNNRSARIGGEIKKILSSLIANHIKDPRVSKLSSITDVEVTRDLSYATVYVSVFDPKHSIEEHLEGLRKAKGFLRSELAKELRVFHTPDLVFKRDDSVAYGNRIEEVLRSLDLPSNDEEEE